VNGSLLQRAAQTRAAKRIIESPLAVVAAFPFRAAAVMRYNYYSAAAGTRWLFGSRENTNYTYDLTERNLRHLSWFIALR
jgi:hypothetical protein